MIGKLGNAKEAWEVLKEIYVSVLSSSKDEGSLREQNNSPKPKVLVAFGTFEDSLLESESDREEGK